jgi:hypothetical protein
MSKKENLKVNWKAIYKVLKRYSDTDFNNDPGQNMESVFTQEQETQQPSTKEEMIEMIKNFLITEDNLKIVFGLFGKMTGNEGQWKLDPVFLQPYRFFGSNLKLNSIIDDLFKHQD